MHRALLAACLVAPAASAAPVPVTADAEQWTRFELRDNYAGAGVSQGRILEGDATYYRARLGLWTDPARFGQGLAAQARFQLQSAGVHGALSGTLNDAPVGVHQAFLRWHGPTHRLDAKRFEMACGDELIIALNPWNQTGRSLDGVRVRLKRRAQGAPWLDLFATRARPDPGAAEPTPRPDGLFEGDDWLLGAYADVGPWLVPATTAELYLLGQLHVADDELQQRGGGVLLVPGTPGPSAAPECAWRPPRSLAETWRTARSPPGRPIWR